MDDATPADRPPPDALPDALPPDAPPPSTITVAPTEVVLELPAPPSALRPSLLGRAPDVVPGVEPDGLDALDGPLLASAGGSLDALRAEALRHLRQESYWRPALRALGLLLGVLLTLRLAFDGELPRLLLAVVGGAAGLALAVLLLHHLNETRRQENLLAALAHLTHVAREHPSQLPLLAPHLDALLSALRANAPVWPSSRPPDALAAALSRASPDRAPPPAP